MSIPSDAELLRRAYEEVQYLCELGKTHIWTENKLRENMRALVVERDEARAAIARVWAVLADPPVPSRMLIPVIRAAIEGGEST